ncbi:MAG: hypothetical protein Q9186_005772 [Xanthomendoza sp. 1 TL-2023]
MQPSRIAQDLVACGMDPTILLAIAQENLHSHRDTMNELPALQKDHNKSLPVLQQSNDMKASKKYKPVVRDIYSVSELIENAPRMIAELETDIEMLTRYLESHKDNDHQKSPSTHEEKSIGGHGGEQRRSSA